MTSHDNPHPDRARPPGEPVRGQQRDPQFGCGELRSSLRQRPQHGPGGPQHGPASPTAPRRTSRRPPGEY